MRAFVYNDCINVWGKTDKIIIAYITSASPMGFSPRLSDCLLDDLGGYLGISYLRPGLFWIYSELNDSIFENLAAPCYLGKLLDSCFIRNITFRDIEARQKNIKGVTFSIQRLSKMSRCHIQKTLCGLHGVCKPGVPTIT